MPHLPALTPTVAPSRSTGNMLLPRTVTHLAWSNCTPLWRRLRLPKRRLERSLSSITNLPDPAANSTSRRKGTDTSSSSTGVSSSHRLISLSSECTGARPALAADETSARPRNWSVLKEKYSAIFEICLSEGSTIFPLRMRESVD
ncbi:hypothetical protein D3C78_1511580 [compost metagenome]